jgi:exodeoxyribonuclease VII small subunit
VWFEQDEPDLDEGLKRFERAMELSAALRERLQEAENTIKEIKLKYGTVAEE